MKPVYEVIVLNQCVFFVCLFVLRNICGLLERVWVWRSDHLAQNHGSIDYTLCYLGHIFNLLQPHFPNFVEPDKVLSTNSSTQEVFGPLHVLQKKKKCLLNLNLHFFNCSDFIIYLLVGFYFQLLTQQWGQPLNSVSQNGYQTESNSDMDQILLKFRAIPSGLLIALAAYLQLFWEFLIQSWLLGSF